jgi:hypothetical protein
LPGWAGSGENAKTAQGRLEDRKYFFNLQTFSQFANQLEFKSNLDFDDFYPHNKMEALHQHKKKICNA